jgi:hypothetical protein
MVFSRCIQNQGGKMGLNKTLLMGMTLMLSSWGALAIDQDYQKKYLTIKKVKVREIQRDVLDMEFASVTYEKDYQEHPWRGLPNKHGQINPINQAGKVIRVAKDLVALGEDIYRLVQKGKPTNEVTYAPISIIPKVDGEPVDVFATENWKTPKKRTYEAVYENLFGIEVVKFRYSIIFAYGGTYEGAGAYITAAQIVPESVSTLFGYDFTATMKLGGIQNNGSRINPVAAATLLMEYTVTTVLKTSLTVDSYNITGRGGFKKL